MNAPIMRQTLQFALVLLAACSFASLPSEVIAQQAKRPGTPGSTGTANQPSGRAAMPKSAGKHTPVDPPAQPAAQKRARPEPEELNIDKLDPRLEEILIQWEQHSAKIKSLHGKHVRREFNKTFEVEKVSEGEFFLETPDKGRIDMIAKPIEKGKVSMRKNAAGEPYQLQPGTSERWVCTGEEILSFNMERREYTRDELPASMRGKNIVHSPLPFLFGMKAEDAKHRFNLTLESVGKDNTVKLKALPRMDTDRQNYQEAWIVLDTKRFVPTAVRLIDPKGLETIYYFESIEINDSGFLRKLKDRFQDPYHPSLKGFTLAMPSDIQPAGNRTFEESNPTRTAGGPVDPAVAPRRDPNIKPADRQAPSRVTNTPATSKKR